jgi:hypothetical protein
VTSSYWQFAKFCLSPKEEIIHQFNTEDKKTIFNYQGYTVIFFIYFQNVKIKRHLWEFRSDSRINNRYKGTAPQTRRDNNMKDLQTIERNAASTHHFFL